MDGTILGQGTFKANLVGLVNPNTGVISISQANPTIIAIPSNADWVSVRNYTAYGAVGAAAGAFFNGTANANVGIEFYWQRGMAAGTGIVNYKAAATAVMSGDTLLSGGFTLYDPSGQSVGSQPLIGNPVATTDTSNAIQPVVLTADTSGVTVGTVVRVSNSAQNDINGIDMVVSAVTVNTSITLLNANNALANVPGAVGGPGFYRIINNANTALFYPRRRIITNIFRTAGVYNGVAQLASQISTAIPHGLTPGQEVRFNIPAVSGMIQLNPNQSNSGFPTGQTSNAIVASVINDYNFTINLDISSYTAFTYPTISQQPSSFPIVIPFGEDTATSLITPAIQIPTIAGLQINGTQEGILADATVNTGFLGMILGSGGRGTTLATPIIGPSGSIGWTAANVGTGDTMYWLAGKSSFGGL